MTDADIIRDVLQRELAPDEPTWAASRARLVTGDRGGWTRGGITVSSLGAWRGFGRDATRSELDALTEADALAFYSYRHVRPFDGLPDPLRVLLVDWGVTSSHLTVWRGVQRACKSMNYDVGPIDGVAGRRTRLCVDSAWRADARRCYLLVLEQRARHYIALAGDEQARRFVQQHPTSQLKFARGWLARCLPFVYEAP